MHETSDVESYGEGHRTFDCPWCGAICGVDPSHVGEHFECPECHKSTKLTDATLRGGHLTEAASDAPHHEEGDEKGPEVKGAHETSDWESYGKGHRTFDCPWCGAISGIDPSHIGEHFDCPECHKGTKLTPDNTRAGHVTEPPPDAPHHEEKSKSPVLLVVAIAVVVGIVGVIVATGGGGDEGDTEVAKTTVPDDVPGETPSATPTEEPGETPTEVPPAEAPPSEDPPAEAPPAEVPPAEDPVDPVVVAKARLDEAQKALALWEQANPGVVRMLAGATVCDAVGGEATRLRAEIAGAEVTPDQARAFNEAMRAFVAADPERVEVAKLLVTRLNDEPVKPLLLASWEEVNFFLPSVGEHLAGVAQSWRALVPGDYVRLSMEVANAEAAVTAASGE